MAKRRKSKSNLPRQKNTPISRGRQAASPNPARQQASALIARILSLLKQGQTQQALELIQEGMRLAPDHPEFPHLAGQVLHRSVHADREAARKWLMRAVELAPRNPQYTVSLAQACLSDDQFDQALELARKAIRADTNFVEAHTTVGLAFVKLGRPREGVVAFENAVRLQPDNADLWKNLALCRLELGQFEAAREAVSKLEASANDPPAALLIELGEIYRGLGEHTDARRYLQEATEKDPSSPEAWFRLGFLLGYIGLYDSATAALTNAERLGFDLCAVRFIEGSVLRKQNRAEEAQRKLEEASQLAGDNVEHILGISWEFAGLREFDAQSQCLDRVLEIDPKDDVAQISLGFGLGVAYEAERDYGRAFDSFAKANALSRKQASFNFESIVDRYRRLFDFYSSHSIGTRENAGCPDSTPIIIAGTSRSGKSLTERLLCLHSAVAPRGEAGVFPQLMKEFERKPGKSAYPKMLQDLSVDTVRWLGQEYVTQLREQDTRHAHLTDTHPGNTIYLGLLRYCLPAAKIVICRRDGRDVCLSMYKSFYANGGYRYAEDLDELGRFWVLHERLLDLWCELFPDAVYEVAFEDLIRSPEKETIALMQFCNIDFDEDYLSRLKDTLDGPHGWPRADDVIGVWKPYQDFLSPLFDALNEPGH